MVKPLVQGHTASWRQAWHSCQWSWLPILILFSTWRKYEGDDRLCGGCGEKHEAGSDSALSGGVPFLGSPPGTWRGSTGRVESADLWPCCYLSFSV